MTCQQMRESAAASLLVGDDVDDVVLAHAEGCAACRAELAELRATVNLLARAGPDVVPPPEQPDDALLGRLLAEVAARRRRRRVSTVLAVAAAVVLVVALGAAVGAVVTRPTGSATGTVATGTARDVATGVTGSARVDASGTGAEVAFTAAGVPQGTVCTLRVVTRDGVRHPVLTWTADYTSAASVTATTAVPADSIMSAELVDERGRLLVPVRVT